MNLSAEKIRTLTGLQDVTLLKETESTNTLLKALAREKDEGAVVIAEKQTAGRGRHGKAFLSPEGGLYLSVLLKRTDPDALTMMAGVAAAEAIEASSGKQARIKWVNDVFIGPAKVCGILCERGADATVVGAGFNLLTPPGGFDPSLAGVAGAIFDGEPVDASLLASRFLNGFFAFLRGEKPYFVSYRAHSFLLGRTVSFRRDGRLFQGVAEDIRPDGALLVRTEKETFALTSGEVSLTDYPRS